VTLKTNPSSVTLLALALSASLAACSGGESESAAGGDSGFPSVAGWEQAGEVLHYDADNLWEYINGAAELFVEFGVVGCQVADLVSGDVTVTLDLYDMGTPLNAYGVYERERPGDDMAVPGAVAGVVSAPYQALLVKGSLYAKVNTFEGELTDESGMALLEALAAALPGSTSRPGEFDLLPEEGRVAGTEGYKPLAFLGRAELTNALYADYSVEGEEAWQGFVILPSAASSVWEGLSGSWASVDHNGHSVLVTEVPYSGLVGVVMQGDRVMGVAEAPDQDTMLTRLETFIQGS
jgi:hypothetical protein